MKSLGGRHWLVGASVQPPSIYPAFHGQTILITAVTQRQTAPPVIQSGMMHLRNLAPASLKEPATKPEDPWQHGGDPWSRASLSSFTSVGSGRTSSLASASETPHRSLAGPTEQRFQSQESRLSALEEGLQQLRVRQETQHQEIVTKQDEDREASAPATR